MSSRDRVHAAYRTYYCERVGRIGRACEVTLGEERQWALNWAKMVALLKHE